MGIYKITNKINNKIYIGSSKNITGRWNYHIDDLFENKHHSYKLQKEFNEFGICCFTFEIIEIVKNKVELLDIEQNWMDYYLCYEDDIGYNVSISSKEKKTKLDLKIELDKIEKEKRRNINKVKSKPPVTTKEIIKNPYCDNYNEIIRAIANQDVEFLKNKIQYKNTYHELRNDCIEEIYKYDFSWFFSSNFILSENNDFYGFKEENRRLFFKRNNSIFNILQTVEMIGKFKSRPKAYKFLLEIFNMSFNEKISRESEDKIHKETFDLYLAKQEREKDARLNKRKNK